MAGTTYGFTIHEDGNANRTCFVQANNRTHALEIVLRTGKYHSVGEVRRVLQQFSSAGRHQRAWPLGTLVIGKPEQWLL